MDLDFRSLRAFVTLAEHMHFGRAAEQLGIAQSALSAHIRRMEDAIGAPLFDRGGRAPVRLTDAGRVMLEEACRTLMQLERTARMGRLAGQGEAGPIRIGYVFSAAAGGVLADLLRYIHDSAPGLSPEPVMMETPQQIRMVEDGTLDIALVRPRPHYATGTKVALVHRDPLVIFMPESCPLAARAAVEPEALDGERFLLPQFAEREGLVGTLAEVAAAGNIPVPPYRQTRDFVSALALCAGGYGLVLAPAALLGLSLSGIVARPLRGVTTHIDLHLLWREGNAAMDRRLGTLCLGFANSRRTGE